MSISVNDYTSKLAQARSDFAESATEMRDNYKEGMEAQKDLHTKRQNQQQENYINQKEESEERSSAHLKRYDKNLREELDERTKRYRDGLEDERSNFADSRRKYMENYNTKLNNISNSFDVASKEQAKVHRMEKESSAERFSDGLAKREQYFNEELSGIQKKNISKLNEFRDQQNREKHDLVNKFGFEKKELVQDANLAKNKLNSAHQLEKETLRESFKQNIDSQKNNSENAKASLLKNKNAERDDMRNTFEELTAEINDRNSTALKKMNRESKSEKRELEKSFGEDRILLEEKANKLANEGSSDNVKKSTKTLNARWQQKVDILEHNAERINQRNLVLNEKLSQDQQNALKQAEIRHHRDLADKNLEIKSIRENEVGKAKIETQEQSDIKNRQITDLEQKIEDQDVLAKSKLKNKVNIVKTESNNLVSRLNDSNTQNLNELKEELLKEQTTFIEKNRRENRDEREELKANLNSSFAAKELSLEKRVKNKEDEKQRLITSYERKLEQLKRKSSEEITALKTLEQDRRVADRKAMDINLKSRQQQFEQEKLMIKSDLDRKLAKSKSNADLHIAKLTERYEKQIGMERKESTKILKNRTLRMNNDYNSLVSKSKMERESLIQQYETRIEALRDSNRVANEIKAKREQS